MQKEQYIIPLPLSIIYNKKGDKFYLNLNQYRNTHFHTLNTCKILFEKLIEDKISHLPKRIKKLDITYTLFTGSKRSVDLANICSIVDKFFCDTLVNAGILIDDGIEYLSDIIYTFGSIDKNNPRVEATLYNLEYEKDEPMKIILTPEETNEVIQNHVRMLFNLKTDQPVSAIAIEDFSYQITLGPATKDIKTKEPAMTNGSGLKEAFDKITPETTENLELVNKVEPPVKTVTQAEAPTAVPVAKSLFANLTRVSNEPT